jgi:Na+/melibiose symporter-like transporter
LTPASYLLGWMGSRPCISFKVLERSPWGWIYVYIYVLVILLFLSFFSRREWTNNQEKKKKCKKLEWNGVEKKRNIENKSSTKVSDHQTTSTKAAIIKTRPRRDFSSIWLLFVRGFLVEGILRSDTYYTSILPIVSFSFLFNYLRENIRTGINAGDHHHVHRSSFRTCLRAPSFFLFYFLFSFFFSFLSSRRWRTSRSDGLL